MSKPKALLSWSSGKDSAFALHEVLKEGRLEVVALLTTVADPQARVAMHGVREELLDRQAVELGLPLEKVRIPSPCPNEIYEDLVGAAVRRWKARGVTHVIFGDLYLEDIRDYREAQLAREGLVGVYPLWKRPTAALAREMLAAGFEARLSCVDTRKVARTLAGRLFDAQLLDELPAGVDPCGENGEFHSFVSACPIFRRPIAVKTGETVVREGFAFADLVPA